MKNKFLEDLSNIVDYKKFSFLLAVSGGVDSMVLLNLFTVSNINFSVAHCNFSLRGEDSDKDEKFVKSICDKLGINFFVKKFNTKKTAFDEKISIQMAARELRYEWFNDLVNKNKIDNIVTAHHFNDNIETVLFNIARGTGISGLKGIEKKQNRLIRPLLNFTKNQVLDYANKNKIEFREDLSNEDEKYKRNKIRKSIIPEFQNVNPGFIESMYATIENFKSAENIYLKFIENEKKRCTNYVDEVLKIDIGLLRKSIEPKTVLFEIIKEFGFIDIDSIFNVIDAGSGKSFYSKKYFLVKNRNKLCISKLIKDRIIEISKEKNNIKDPIKMSLKFVDNFKLNEIKNKKVAVLNYDKLEFPLTIRTWKEGDWFIPSGMKGKKKLSDYFIDNKFSLIEKKRCFVLCSNNEIVWIVGHRIDERYKFVDGLEKAYICQIK